MKKEMSGLTKILLVVGIFLALFIVAMIVTFWKFQMVPDVLVSMVLGAGGVEAFVSAGIQISKVITKDTTHRKKDEE